MNTLVPSYRDEPSEMEGYPMRAWHVEVYLLNQNGEEVPANIFEKAVYKLHPSFGKQRATQSMFISIHSHVTYLLCVSISLSTSADRLGMSI